jgi:hypothetical protein
MQGFQAVNINAVRSDRVTCTVKMGDLNVKAFQILFGKDGSLFITFPYCRHTTGILSSSTIPASGNMTNDVNVESGGKVSSHLVKYSHHLDGRAHFSQDGKIYTAIKRQSVALATQNGHLFSLLVQGLAALEPVDPIKDLNKPPKKSVIEFAVNASDSVKFVGSWYNVDTLRFPVPTPTIGPILNTCDPDGVTKEGCIVASPRVNARHVLLLTCEPIPSLGPDPEIFCFYGGFDPPHIMNDLNTEAGFLTFRYPIEDEAQLRTKIGTVDYTPTHMDDR